MTNGTFVAPLLVRNPPPLQLVTARGAVIATSVTLAGDSASRRRGLLGRAAFPEGEALVIAPCNAVHSFFMKFAIDVVYVDREGHVLKVRERLVPWRMSGCLHAFATIELPAGSVATSRVERGDTLCLAHSETGFPR